MDWMRVYWRLPPGLQNIIISAYAIRLNHLYFPDSYQGWCRWFDERESWPEERWRAWQVQRLQEILMSATRTPYWRRLFTEAGVEPTRMNALEVLKALPLLEKDPIRRDPLDLVDERYPRQRLWVEKTSGTTGTSLKIYWPREMVPQWWALHERRVRAWAGVSQRMPRAMVGGRPVVPGNRHRPPYWVYNWTWRQLYLSSYHISSSTAGLFLDAIVRYGSEWLTGYGSAIALLAEEQLAQPRAGLRLRAVLTSGDTLLPQRRDLIERAFGCAVFDGYSSAEGCLVISECEHHRLHVQPESGILEILREDGSPAEPGEVGEMVCTGLINSVMPLIRYRIGDYAAWSMERFCPCGRTSPLIESLEGRVDDYLVLPDGRRIGRLSTAMKKAPTIRTAQIVQDRPDRAVLLVVPDTGYFRAHAELVRKDIQERIGDFDIAICEVSEIPRAANGKQKLVVRIYDNPLAAEPYRNVLASLNRS